MDKILIADDNQGLIQVLSRYATQEGYEVVVAYDGKQAIELFNKEKIDLVLLDIMMPYLDGYEVCKQIRSKSDVPIIMITAKGEDFERILGLEIGADDYVVKPFSVGEVMARIKAMLRRIKRIESKDNLNVLSVSNLTVDIEKYTVLIDSQKIALTKRETELLYVLMQRSGYVYTREMLLDQLWGYDYYGDSRVVDSHIKRLRSKLAEFEHPDWDVKTVYGVGYQFEKIQ